MLHKAGVSIIGLDYLFHKCRVMAEENRRTRKQRKLQIRCTAEKTARFRVRWSWRER